MFTVFYSEANSSRSVITLWVATLALVGCPSNVGSNALDASTSQDSAPKTFDTQFPDTHAFDVQSTDARVPVVTRSAPAIGSGFLHTCALQRGAVWCWGDATSLVPEQSATPRVTAIQVLPRADVAELWSGNNFSCLRSNVGEVSCWGSALDGVLGNGVAPPGTRVRSPTRVEGLDGVLALRSGAMFSCALRRDGRVWCWGNNALGQEGGQFMNVVNDRPEPVPGIEDAVDLYVRAAHACVVRRDGRVLCWGANAQGQCGAPAAPGYVAPIAIPDVHDAIAVSTGGDFSCALRANRTVMCWGANDHGQLGDGTTDSRNTSVEVQTLRDVVELSAGILSNVCARTRDGGIWCWGGRDTALIGDGFSTSGVQPRPTRVASLEGMTEISIGGVHACARSADGMVMCWGDRRGGRIGDGVESTNPNAPPSRVVFP
jgi:alpha-tubulin suppressor-like RCC1 family protein